MSRAAADRQGELSWAGKKKSVLLLTGVGDVDARIGKLGDMALLEKKLKSNCGDKFEKTSRCYRL